MANGVAHGDSWIGCAAHCSNCAARECRSNECRSLARPVIPMRISLRTKCVVAFVAGLGALWGMILSPFGLWDYALGAVIAACFAYFTWIVFWAMKTRKDFVDRFRARQRQFCAA